MPLIWFSQFNHTCIYAKFRSIAPTHSKDIFMSTYAVILSWIQLYVVDEARVIFLKSKNFKILTKKVLISQRRLIVG